MECYGQKAIMVSHHFSPYGSRLSINRGKKRILQVCKTHALSPFHTPHLFQLSDLAVGESSLESISIRTYFVGFTVLAIFNQLHPLRSELRICHNRLALEEGFRPIFEEWEFLHYGIVQKSIFPPFQCHQLPIGGEFCQISRLRCCLQRLCLCNWAFLSSSCHVARKSYEKAA